MGPGRPRSERSDDRNIEYSPSGTSSTSPVSPPHTVSDINSMLSVAGGSLRRCPQAPPSPLPLRLFYQGQRWGLPQKSALPPLATTTSLPQHTESLCWQTVPGNSRSRCSLLRLFLYPWDGRHRRLCRRYGRRRCNVRKRRCSRRLRGWEASYWTAVTLPPAKWRKYKGLGLNFQRWQRSERHVTLMGDKVIKTFNEKVNRRRCYQWKKSLSFARKKIP